ncbi:DUF1592 domain-containing protein [Armatimonas sp.]|uniref:DUF1592 domain-containing protein n=1 Tax=Armatimonas sp. TaxID=1872638 RepID=UPI00374D5C52
MTRRLAFAATLTLTLGALAAEPQKAPQSLQSLLGQDFLKANCVACHNSSTKEGKLDLIALKLEQLDNPKVFALWAKVHDRVRDGEMPPKDVAPLSTTARAAFLKSLEAPLIATDDVRVRREGRAIWRRMNRYEYENTLRDLLDAPWLQVKEMLPEDGEVARFNKVGEALDVSYVQMGRYLAAAEYALREVLARETTRPTSTRRRFYAREQNAFTGKVKFGVFNTSPERATFPMIGSAADIPALEGTAPMTVGAANPLVREQEAMGVVASTYEPLEIKFSSFKAPAAGRYKLRLKTHSFWAAPDSEKRWWRPSRQLLSAGRTQEPVSLYAETPPRLLRKLGNIETGPEPSVSELDVYLLKGETVRPDAVRLFRSRPPGSWHNPLAQKDGQPGVAFQWLEVEGPLSESWPSKGHTLLFGDLPLKIGAKGKVEVVSSDPSADAERLLRGFLTRTYRRPVRPEDIQPFLKLAQTALEGGDSFTDALLTTYSAVLCSPAFVTLEEKPGPLSDHALATRLAYFLGNSEPDTALRLLADQKTLRKPGTLSAQTDRLLADPKSQRFVGAFLDYWLDLRKINNTSPDAELYPDYYLDDYLVESATEETQHFFTELVRNNLPARNLVASDFVMVNQRLAEHYGLPGVKGIALRKVALPPDSPRGGLLTQTSVLKVTANGTTTSPVLRGAWIMERILGQPVPPPPTAVPAVEPDTRGAVTIRQQLDKHRTNASCNSCHSKMDPAGFALESFDVAGGWRERYRALGEGAKVAGYGKNGQPFEFHPAQPIDATGVLPDGRRFQDVRELKTLLLKDERQLARNLVRQLVVYATGAPIRFGDRPKIEAILDRAAPSRYGVKSLIHAIVESELFQNK